MEQSEIWDAFRTVIKLRNMAPPLVSVSKNAHIHLSFPQERLWLLSQFNPGSCAYNIPYVLRLQGALNTLALEESLREIWRRHQTLQTTFKVVESQPIQVITPHQTFALKIVNLQHLPPSDRDSQARRLATEEAQQPFNLSQGPLFRGTLLQLSPEEHWLLITFHHIVYDYWSENVLWRELTVLYAAFSTQQPSPLEELPIQYADFALWQRQWLQQEEVLEMLLSYWQKQLGSKPLPPNCLPPPDKKRPILETRRSAYQKLALSQKLTEALQALTSNEGVTLFQTLLAAFQLLLHGYTGQDALYLCSPVANRNRQQLEGLIGYFINLVILRSHLEGDPSFREFLQQVTQVVSGAYAYQDLPVQMLNSLGLVRSPLSQVMFALLNTPRQTLELSGLTVNFLEIDSGTTDFDLYLYLVEEANTLTGKLTYNRDLFDETTIIQILENWQTLLQNLVANPEKPISQLFPPTLSRRQKAEPTPNPSKEGNRRFQGSPDEKISPPEDESGLFPIPHSPFPIPHLQVRRQEAKIEQHHSPLIASLQEYVAQVLGISSSQLNLQLPLQEMGLGSLMAMDLRNQVKIGWGVDVPIVKFIEGVSIASLANYVSEQLSTVATQSGLPPELVPLQVEGTKPPFFCVHPLAGVVFPYYDLANLVGKERPFYGIQSVGIDDGRQPLTSIEEMAGQYIKAIQVVQPEGLYFLGGWSYGAVVAFEMARQLQQAGQKVAFLALIDMPSPYGDKTQNFLATYKFFLTSSTRLIWPYVYDYLALVFAERQQQIDSSFNNREGQKLGALSQILRSQSRPMKFRQPTARRMLQVTKANIQAMINYTPTVYPGKITLFRTSKPCFAKRIGDESWGWSDLAEEGVEIHFIPGHHFNLLRYPHVEVLAQKLQAVPID
ncbi:MAG: hypothetical protein F6K47_23660 [Symploca sp. SIO2E6]|nr:hypothetical protein [Symploca sp. SIO2E6]